MPNFQGRGAPGIEQIPLGLADMLASVLRGSTKAALGMPGDIESMFHDQTVFPTSERVGEMLPPMKPLSPLSTGDTFEKLGEYNPIGLGGIAKDAGKVAKALRTEPMGVAMKVFGTQPAHVVRPKGGNFLTSALPPVNPNLPEPIKKFMETKYAKYLRTQFGSKEDPLRAVGDIGEGDKTAPYVGQDNSFFNEQIEDMVAVAPETLSWGKQHLKLAPDLPPNTWDRFTGDALRSIDDPDLAKELVKFRKNPGSVEAPWRQRDLGNLIKDTALFTPEHVADFERMIPFITKETPLVFPKRGMNYAGEADQPELKALGRSTQDYIKMAMNPDQHGPKVAQFLRDRNLTLSPADLEKSSVKDILDKRYEFNEWQDSYKNPDAPINAATKGVVVGDYGKWVKYDPEHPDLRPAMEKEGKLKSHCVGDYCEAVAGYETDVYSLRDKVGEPKITLELEPGSGGGRIKQVFRQANAPMRAKDFPAVQSLIDKLAKEGKLDKGYKQQFDARKLRADLHPRTNFED